MEGEKKFPIVIKLKKPVDCGDETQLTEIKIKREPTGGDWGNFNLTSPTTLDYLRIASKISGVPLPVLKKIDTNTVFQLIEVVSDFLD